MSLGTIEAAPEQETPSTNTIRGYNFRMHDSEFRVLKQASLDTRMTLRDMFAEAMSDWLARKGVPLSFEPISTKKE